uniref:Uncharacterized protein LOC104230990 n=1 Tax=Nicotiana sylvestris TaxID=4096 RepID=A0A1U7X6V8_NICSY|nr:PREDICTED: uncharacterized protein LOC104230990 [Nicotiana sylvestris]
MKILVTHGKRIREISKDDITFIEEDVDGLLLSHNDTLVLKETDVTKSTAEERLVRRIFGKKIPFRNRVESRTQVAVHKLSLDPNFPLVRRKKRLIAEVKNSPGLMPLAAKEAVSISGTISRVWTLFTNGASNVKGTGLGVVLITPLGETLRKAIRIVSLTNNEVEYEALVAGLELTWGLGSEVIEVMCDSQLVVNNT